MIQDYYTLYVCCMLQGFIYKVFDSMAQISEIVTESESSQINTSGLSQVLGMPLAFGEAQSHRVELCTILRRTISPTERFMKAFKSNPVK